MLIKKIAILPKTENTERIKLQLKPLYAQTDIELLDYNDWEKAESVDIVLYDLNDTLPKNFFKKIEEINKKISSPTVFLVSNMDDPFIDTSSDSPKIDFVLKRFENREIRSILDLIYFKHKYSLDIYNDLQFDTLIDTLHEGIVVVDENEDIVFCSSSAAKIFDCDKDSILGSNIAQLLDNDAYLQIIKQTRFRKKGISGTYSLEIVTNNNNKRYIQINATPRFLENKYIGSLATIIDITSQKDIEFELQEKNHHMKNLLTVATDLTSSLKLEKLLIKIGRGAKELLRSDKCEIFFKKRNKLNLIVSIPQADNDAVISMDDCELSTFLETQKALYLNKNINNKIGLHHKHFKNISENIIIAPLIVRDKSIGVLILMRKSSEYTIDDLFVAETYAAFAASAINNSQIFEVLQKEIKNRKSTAEKLKRTQFRLSSVLNNVPNIVLYELDNETKQVFVTDNFSKLTGYSSIEITKNQNFLYKHIHPDDEKLVKAKIRKWLEKPSDILTIWFRFKKASGEYVWLEDRKAFVKQNGGKTFITGVLIDNTNLKKAEEALRKSESRYRAVVEDQTEFVNRFTPEGTFLFINEAYAKYLNKSVDELIGKNWIDMYPKRKQELVRNRLKQLSKENPVNTYEYEKVLSTGEVKWEEWTYRAIFASDGTVQEIQSVGKDITERKKAEQLLLRERNRAEFFTDLMSHDINNLNHGIFSYLNIILRDKELSPQTQIRLKTCLHLSEEISSLIGKVRLLSDIDDGSINTKVLNITEIMENVIKTVSINNNKRNITVTYDFEDKDLLVKANELLETVIYNILNNAVKHNDKEEIKINVTHFYSKYTRFYRFEFHDNGPGVIDENKERIFNRMERAGAENRVHGFGLGLTLVKNIVENFGGKVWVEDNVFGDYTKGANFIILIPGV